MLYFRDLFSEFIIVGFDSWEYASCIGKENLLILTDRLKNSIESYQIQVRKLKSEIQFLTGKTGSDFKKISNKIDFIPEMGMRKDGWSGEEPLCENASKTKREATNYSMCGWCKHASGSHRYSYCIDGTCHYTKGRVKFIDKCSLIEKDKLFFEDLIKNLLSKVDNLKLKVKNSEEGIEKLLRLAEKAESKPMLTTLRPIDFYEIGKDILFYPSNGTKWIKGTMRSGYRTHDGIVNFLSHERFHDNMDFDTGKGGNIYQDSSEIMYEKDLKFLKQAKKDDPIFYDIWLKNCSREKGHPSITIPKYKDNTINRKENL